MWDRLYLSGTWSRIESQLHVKFLELKAVFLALQGFEEILISQLILALERMAEEVSEMFFF